MNQKIEIKKISKNLQVFEENNSFIIHCPRFANKKRSEMHYNMIS